MSLETSVRRLNQLPMAVLVFLAGAAGADLVAPHLAPALWMGRVAQRRVRAHGLGREISRGETRVEIVEGREFGALMR